MDVLQFWWVKRQLSVVHSSPFRCFIITDLQSLAICHYQQLICHYQQIIFLTEAVIPICCKAGPLQMSNSHASSRGFDMNYAMPFTYKTNNYWCCKINRMSTKDAEKKTRDPSTLMYYTGIVCPEWYRCCKSWRFEGGNNSSSIIDQSNQWHNHWRLFIIAEV